MARLARNEVIDRSEVQVLHVVSRCVRRAFFCGDDPVSGQCYEHRRQWIRDRLEFLASVCLASISSPERASTRTAGAFVGASTDHLDVRDN